MALRFESPLLPGSAPPTLRDVGVDEGWFSKPEILTNSIQVPGSWQGQGFGHDGVDEVWDFRVTARVFQATYKGTAWYARTLQVPEDWGGDCLWLNFGGVHPSAEVWLEEGPHRLRLEYFEFRYDAQVHLDWE